MFIKNVGFYVSIAIRTLDHTNVYIEYMSIFIVNSKFLFYFKDTMKTLVELLEST